MTRAIVLLLICLLLTAGAQAGGPAGLTAERMALQEGEFSGQLGALATDDWSTSAPGSGLGSIQLEAGRARAEVDWAEAEWQLVGGSPMPADRGTQTIAYHEAHFITQTAGPEAYVFVQALPGSPAPQFSLGGSAVIQEARESVAHRAFVESRPSYSEAPRGLQVTAGSAVEVVIEGDFLLTVWDLDLHVESSDGSHELWTGERREAVAGAGGVRLVDHSRFQQAYLFVTDGRLVLDVAANAGLRALLAPDGHVEGEWSLHRATGPLPGRAALDREDVRLTGSASVAADGTGLLVQPEAGTVATIDGATYAWTNGPSPWLWLLVLGVLPAIAMRRRWQHQRLRRAVRASDHDRMLRRGRPLLKSRRHGREAQLAAVVALLQTGHHEEAAQFLLSSRNRIEAGMREYLLAHAACLEGDLGTAAEWLRRCFEAGPELRVQAEQNPMFSALLLASDDRDVT